MRIEFYKNYIEFVPENDVETMMLENLWKYVVDCVRFSKKLVPMGEYVPGKHNVARFMVEGEKGVEEYPVVFVDRDCRCYCQTCNKYVELKRGDRIPPCCGKLMEILD